MDNIDNKYNPQLCKIFLAISDLIFFNLALWFSLGCVYFILIKYSDLFLKTN